MKRIQFYSLIISCNLLATLLMAQQPLLQYEADYHLKAVWQEYLPEHYAINDSIILSAGLSTNMNTLSMNIFVRWMHIDGTILREREILNIDNPEGFSYALPTYDVKSAIDKDFLYIIAVSDEEACASMGEMERAYRFCKVSIADGSVVKDSLVCFNDIRVYQDISTFEGNDTLFLYGSIGYLNQQPKIILSTMTKDFKELSNHEIRTEDTRIIPLGISNDPRAVAGSHHLYGDDYDSQDIWFGEIESDSIRQDFRMKYFDGNILRKSIVLDDREKAFVSYEIPFSVSESSIYLFRDDTLRWNFYKAHFLELEDIRKIGSHYCILESSFGNFQGGKDKIILHYIDEEGFPYGSNEFDTPWIAYAMTGLLIDNYYFAFVFISNDDVLQQVANGEILKEEAHFEYTHVFKLKINE